MPHDTTVGGAPGASSTLQDWFRQRYVLQTHNARHADGLPKFVADPAGSERQVMVLHLESSDAPYPSAPAQRTEIAVKGEYVPPGQERWYALSFYLDQHWPIYDDKTTFCLMQIHTSSKTAVLQPPIEVRALGNRLWLAARHNTRPVPPTEQASDYPPHDSYYATKANSAQAFVSLGKLKLKQWYCFVVYAGWSRWIYEGALKVWCNGAMVHEQHLQPNAYENLDATLGLYPKIGVYAPGGFNAEQWAGKTAWVKSYVDWIYLADPGGGIGPAEMFAKTPVSVVPESAFPV